LVLYVQILDYNLGPIKIGYILVALAVHFPGQVRVSTAEVKNFAVLLAVVCY